MRHSVAMKLSVFLAMMLAAAFALTVGVCADVLVVDDPLQGSTIGNRSGGSFVAGGWTTLDNNDSIIYSINPAISKGRFEFDVTGLVPQATDPADGKGELAHMYDNYPNDADVNKMPGYDDNLYQVYMRKLGVNYAPDHDDAMKVIANAGVPGSEDYTAKLAWNASTTYHFTITWEPDTQAGTTIFRFWRDTTLLKTLTVSGTYTPVQHRVRIGASARQNGVPNAIFSNLKVWNLAIGGVRQWSPTEFTASNTTYSGNPYDLLASATFVHAATGEHRTTEMFYAGGSTWKFRFTPTRSGQWTYATSSSDSDLNGLTGSVTVEPAEDDEYGFVSNEGKTWIRPRGASGASAAFVPQFVMYAHPAAFYNNPGKIDADIQTFFVQHGFNGFHTGASCRWFDLDHDTYDDIPSMDPNPDPRTFEALELLINKVHAAGGVVHLWAWGDESRHMTPIKWGINGAVDKRLQRYIAARLGPLPGWTMGYGFDLWEWVQGSQLTEWHDYLQQKFGWKHMLGARNYRLDEWTQLSEALDYSSYEQWRPDYNKYVQTIEDRPSKPSFSEDRFRVRDPSPYPEKDYNELDTRRGLWHSTMAGGVANIWGYLINSPADGGSAPYPHPEWSRTYASFFSERFLLGMVRDNAITNGVCLRTPDLRNFLFYREGANSVYLNLSTMPSEQPAVAVDTTLPYEEISLGVLQPGQHTWTAPRVSDWAIAVGTGGGSPYCFPEPFNYPNGNLNGNTSWTGSATSEIAVLSNYVKITGGTLNNEATYPVSCAGSGGIIDTYANVKSGVGGGMLWGLWFNDPNGNNLARWYGWGTTAKPRIGGTGAVLPQVNLTGGWDILRVRIDTSANTSEFFFNGTSIGTLSHAETGAGDSIGSVMLERIYNSLTGDYIYLDNIAIGPGPLDITPPGPVTSFVAADQPTQVNLSWTNPTDADYAGTRIVYKTAGTPGGPLDGTVVYNGTGTNCAHTSPPGGTINYAAYAYDGVGNYSTTAANASVTRPVQDCFSDSFTYSNGNLNGKGGWSGTATSQIAVEDNTVKMIGGATAYTADQTVSCTGSGGVACVRLKVKNGVGTHTLWNLCIDDPTGKNLARWYGMGTSARGRIGTGSLVATSKTLTGGWDDLYVKINFTANTSEFFFNGASTGTLSHAETGAGDSIGRLRFERENNSSAAGEYVYLDDLVAGASDVTPPTASISAPSIPITKTCPVSYTVSFSEPVYGFSSSSDIQLNSTGDATAGSTVVTGSGSGPYTVTLSSISGDGTLGITVKSAAADDVASNANTASAASATLKVIGADGRISDIKDDADNTPVSLANKALYLKRSGFGYIEEIDRTTGIRVEGALAGSVGDLVALSGVMGTKSGGERYVVVDAMASCGTGSVDPLGLNNRALIDAIVCGLYVKVWGKVKPGSIIGNSYVLTDGSNDAGIKVITPGAPGVTENEFVTVIGAAGLDGVRAISRE